jgi:hypothetical protein
MEVTSQCPGAWLEVQPPRQREGALMLQSPVRLSKSKPILLQQPSFAWREGLRLQVDV